MNKFITVEYNTVMKMDTYNGVTCINIAKISKKAI